MSFNSLYAQQKKADFEMKIWVEDSKGNRDSMIIGYVDDDNLYDKKLHPEYGEKLNIAPFDSVLEIRGAKNNYPQNDDGFLSKKIIARYAKPTGFSCGLSIEIPMYINAKYLPIKIIIDTNALFSNGCNKTSHIFPSSSYFVIANKWSSIGLQCMNENPVFATDFKFTYQGQPLWNTIFHKQMIQGKQDIQKIPGVMFKFDSFGGCKTKTSTLEQYEDSNIKVFPNPNTGNTTNVVLNNTQSFTQGTWQLCDAAGQNVAIYPMLSGHSEYQFALPDLPNGIYLWRLVLDGNVRRNGKLVIIE
jgi:hypothetical protein